MKLNGVHSDWAVVPWTSKISKSRLSQHLKLKKLNLSSLLKQMKTMKRKPVSSPEEFP